MESFDSNDASETVIVKTVVTRTIIRNESRNAFIAASPARTLSPPVSVDLDLEAVKRFYEELAVGPARYFSPRHRHAFISLVP